MDYLTSALTLGGYLQSHTQHREELHTNNELTQQQIDESERQHQEQIDCTIDLHNIQHTHNKRSAEREGLRDLWAQYNQKNQTSIITLTLLFSCCFMIIVEGRLPLKVSTNILVVYSILISLQTIFITISLILVIKIQSRMTKFNIFDRYHVYDCGQRHETFSSYYEHHCKKIKSFSNKLSNAGLLCIFLSTNILWSSQLSKEYESKIACNISIIFNIMGLFILIYALTV